jgi:hypothetical protein
MAYRESERVSRPSASSRAVASPTQPLNGRSPPRSSRAIPRIGSLVVSTSSVTVCVWGSRSGT